METLRYDYKPKAWTMALAALFFAGCALVLANVAMSNDRGLIINRVIDLDTSSATTFYWVLTVASVLFVIAGLWGLIRAFGAPQQIVLDGTSITAPKGGLSRTIVTVPLASITDVRLTQVQSQRFLVIHHPGGKLTINRSMLTSDADFDELVAAIHARQRAGGQ